MAPPSSPVPQPESPSTARAIKARNRPARAPEARQDPARQDPARQDPARQDPARQDPASQQASTGGSHCPTVEYVERYLSGVPSIHLQIWTNLTSTRPRPTDTPNS
ncbi:hypothetical protein HYQ44_010296 [Verticillium longisporum]|nr:hypothetical protein HYQ44_010296 [Verticillium longisporum]